MYRVRSSSGSLLVLVRSPSLQADMSDRIIILTFNSLSVRLLFFQELPKVFAIKRESNRDGVVESGVYAKLLN